MMLRTRKGSKRISLEHFNLLLILPAIGVLTFISAFPLFYNLCLSVQRYDFINRNKTFVGLSNYRDMLKDPAFWNALRNTLALTLTVVIVEMALGLAAAVLINRSNFYTKVARALLGCPLMIAPVVVALQWRWILADQYGILNYFLSKVGIKGLQWFANARLAFLSVALVDVWQTTPFVTMVLLAGLKSLPVEPFEAAKVDGASTTQVFKYLTLPLLRPALLVALIIRTGDAIRIFDSIYVLTGGGPGNATEVLGILTYKKAFAFLDFNKASALSIISLAVSATIGAAYVRVLRKE